MAVSSEDYLYKSMAGLKVDDRDREPNQGLLDAGDRVIQAAREIDESALHIRRSKTSIHRDSKMAELHTMATEASKVASAIQACHNASQNYFLRRLNALVSPKNVYVKRLLMYFRHEICKIIRRNLDNANPDTVLPRILEECSRQSLGWPGTLVSHRYFVESNVSLHKQCEVFVEWKDFWLAALTKCPGGPTLFNPPAPLEDGGIWLAPPRYLFRVSDSRSSGTSNGSFVASIASVSTPDESRLDLLSLDEEEARKRLYGHLTKSTVVGDIDDNLMSWTSSLLFAIQYAIYRSHQLGCHPNDVEIIAVDTSKFHKGQFGRDLELLHRCKAREDGRPELKRFMDMRLRIDYDNGEYLSQGTVDIEGRCCMTTLEELLNAGLYRLYPEFQDLEGATQWTNRVKNLRTLWAQQGATDGLESDLVRSEITQAFCIARSCFSGLGAFDFALMLFVFKNRPVQMSWLNESRRKSANILGVEDQGPIEVQRYSLLAEKISSYRQEQSELNAEFFKEIFYRAWPVHRIIEPAQHTMDLDSYIEDRLDEPNFTWN